MIQDLHSHTYYSYCGKDSPEAVIKNAIKISFPFTLNRGQKLSYGQSNADENGETESLTYC